MRRAIAFAFTIALSTSLACSTGAFASGSPYARLPSTGDHVSFDGAVGGESFAWAFYNEYWLQTYMRFTIEAARDPAVYSKSQAALMAIGDHTLSIKNGVHGMVEESKHFQYGGREDVEVRVMLQDGDLRGSEVWTSAGELVDSAGKTYLKP